MSIKLSDVNYTYMKDTPFEKTGIKNINLEISEGEFVAIIGHTGSGKSTLVQHLKGLLTPDSGTVIIDDVNINQNTNPEEEPVYWVKAGEVATFTVKGHIEAAEDATRRFLTSGRGDGQGLYLGFLPEAQEHLADHGTDGREVLQLDWRGSRGIPAQLRRGTPLLRGAALCWRCAAHRDIRGALRCAARDEPGLHRALRVFVDCPT